jgi:uncharacterized metal-binding protein YceD (DUF177 family)
MSAPELSRTMRVHEIGGVVRHETIVANESERAALAARFGLLSLDTCTADLDVVRGANHIRVTGRFAATGTQPCVVSAEPVPFDIAEPVDLRYSDGEPVAEAEIELEESDLDDLPLGGDELDLGEAVAQSLGLALDPYPRAPAEVRAAAARFVITEAEAQARAAADKAAANPFNILKK